MKQWVAVAAMAAAGGGAIAQQLATMDAAAAFGARQQVSEVILSPDGKMLAYLAPLKGQASAVYTSLG